MARPSEAAGDREGGGNGSVPPLEEVDVLSTSTASFRSQSEEGNHEDDAVVEGHAIREAEGS